MSETTSPPPSLAKQLQSYSRTYWLANVMEMLERLAYFGLRVVLPIYMVLALEAGGPQFDHTQKASIYAIWALVQSGVPVISGGFADRYGYRATVGVAIAIKMLGYLVMGYAVAIAAWLSAGESLTVPGHATTYAVFLAGAVALALGTAVFKPGLQGIISQQLTEQNASVGWSVFYQVVNVGGFLGPYLAGVMKLLAWRWVFLSCAIIVSLNYLVLLVIKEPPKQANRDDKGRGLIGGLVVLWHGVIGICEPRLAAFLVVFSGFWAMFNQLFDLLPNYIEDWVDSSSVVNTLVAPLFNLLGRTIPADWGGNLPQEQMINLNAGMCMLFAFAVGYITGKFRAMNAMIVGILISTAAIFSLGLSLNGWAILGAIALFSVGELTASPTKMRYFSQIAPPGKKAMYLGYINATNGIGWTLGSLIAGDLYQHKGDKVVLARRYLVEQLGQQQETVAALPKTEVLPHLASAADLPIEQLRPLLAHTYNPGQVWATFALIGIISMVALIGFDLITRKAGRWESPALVVLAGATATATYGLKYGVGFALAIVLYLVLQVAWPSALPEGQGNREAV